MNREQKNNKKSRHGKASRILLWTAVLFACLLLFLTQFLNYLKVRGISGSDVTAQTPGLTDMMLEQGMETYLYATSTEEDLYIVIRDADGHAVEGQVFTLDLEYPNGSIFTYESQPNGSCYLENLPSGEYRISMRAENGYFPSGPLTVQIKSRPERVYSVSGNSVLDENGDPTFSYTFETDENGYLLYKKTHEASDVVLINDEKRGEIFGLRFISPADFADDQSLTLHCEQIELIRPDNTVNDTYSIEAVPLTSPDGQSEGWQLIDGKICYINSAGRKLRGLQTIAGKTYFFDDDGNKAESLGIDVSSYNGFVNWQAAKESGIDFAILRVGGRGWTSGKPYIDCFMYNYIRDARRAGIKLGLYFYSTAITPQEAVQEANFTLKRLGGISLDLPIYFDSEYSGEYPDGRADLLKEGPRTDIARAFCETIECAGYEAGVYASQNFWGTAIDYLPLSQYSIWLANYTGDYAMPSFYYDYDIWQFTAWEHVSGFAGGVDMNVIF